MEVISELKLNLVNFWRHRLWDNFPKDYYAKREEGSGATIHYINFKNKTPFLIVPHPSSSKFNYGLTDRIKDYIKLMS
jgi:hypothetical protein